MLGINVAQVPCPDCLTPINQGHAADCRIALKLGMLAYAKAFQEMWGLLVLIETIGADPQVMTLLRAHVAAVVFGSERDPDEAMRESVAWTNQLAEEMKQEEASAQN